MPDIETPRYDGVMVSLQFDDIETLDRVCSRLRRLAQTLRLPNGAKVTGVDAWTFMASFNGWATDWLAGEQMHPNDEDPLPVMWEGHWPDWFVELARDSTDDREVVIAMYECVTSAFVDSMRHEFIEHATYAGRPIWEAHPGRIAATATRRMIDRDIIEPELRV